MTSLMVNDTVRFAHLLAIAVGLGASVMVGLQILRRVYQRITEDLHGCLRHYRGLVWISLVVMWLSAHWVCDRELLFSPELFSKLAIVSMLTLNAIPIGSIAMPMLERSLSRKCVCVRIMASV